MRKSIPAIIIVMLFCLQVSAQMSIRTITNADSLAQVIVGKGVKITNAHFTGGTTAAGIFQNNAAQAPFLSQGVILTTGYVATGSGLIGVNNSASALANNSVLLSGDNDLNVFSGKSTFDACVLEFDFIPQGDSISVQYVFASEEYPRYNCSNFNDVFAFLISGPGYPNPTNIALVPGTNIPVSINSINDGTTSNVGNIQTCRELGPGAPFTQYYINNKQSKYVVYDGMSSVFKAQAKVKPCEKYHLKLAIADGFDGRYDSGVFIEANSLSSNNISIKSAQGFSDADHNNIMVEDCKGAQFIVSRNENSVTDSATVNLVYAGSAVYGTDYLQLPTRITFLPGEIKKTIDVFPMHDGVTEGTENLIAYVTQSGCSGMFVDSAMIYINDSISFHNKSDTFTCGIQPVLLNFINHDGLPFFSNKWNTGDTTQSILAMHFGTYTSIINQGKTCYAVDTFGLADATPHIDLGADTVICDRGVLMLNANNLKSTYNWSTGSTDSIIAAKKQGTYWVQVKNQNGCTASDTMHLTIKTLPVVNLGGDTGYCPYQQVALNATFPGASYKWNTGDTINKITVFHSGIYRVTLGLDGCYFSDSIRVREKLMPFAEVKDSVIDVLPYGTASLQAMPGRYNDFFTWSPQTSLNSSSVANPLATPEKDISYILTVTSRDGCVAVNQVTVRVKDILHIPNAFSPNGDGVNDTWQIPLLNSYIHAQVKVFERSGREVFTSNGYNINWDGTYAGKRLPEGTYYYVIDPENGAQIKSGWLYIKK